MTIGLIDKLRRRGIFARLDPQDAAALFSSARLVRADPGALLIAQGETSRDYLVLLEGELEVRREWRDAEGAQEARVGRVLPGEGVGEAAVLSALPRSASVYAVSAARLLRIDGALMDELLGWCGPLGARLDEDARLRRRMNTVRQSGPFRQLPLATAQCAFERMEPLDLAAGTAVVREGEPGDAFYLVESGRAVVRRAGAEVAEIGPGGTFGEEALLLDAPRNATVTMAEAGRLWRIDKRSFDESLRAALVEEVGADEAARIVADGGAWIDCRVEEEFAEARIPGARLLPLHALRARMDEFDRGRAYVVYCRSGPRAACAAFLMRQRGLRAYALRGGLLDWPGALAEGGA